MYILKHFCYAVQVENRVLLLNALSIVLCFDDKLGRLEVTIERGSGVGESSVTLALGELIIVIMSG